MDIQKTMIERITITCPDKQRRKAMDYVYDNGYFVRSSGPKPTGACTVDHTQFQIVAEKEVPNE